MPTLNQVGYRKITQNEESTGERIGYRGIVQFQATAVVVEAPAVATGGWLRSYPSKSDEERRLERIKLGIIPPDLPEPIKTEIAQVAEGRSSEKQLRAISKQYRENASKLIRIAKSLATAFADFEREQALMTAQMVMAHLEQEIVDHRRRQRNSAAIILMMEMN